MSEAAPDGAQMATIDAVTNAFRDVRAEYEADDVLFEGFSEPSYFPHLLGIAPAFLVGGRGTGKTTTLRSMTFRGQHRIHGGQPSASWRVVGAYWKAEPNTVSAFRGRGLSTEAWEPIFAHYLNLRLTSLVLDYANWTISRGAGAVSVDCDAGRLLCRSLHISQVETTHDLSREVAASLVEVEAKLNGSIKALTVSPMSVLGSPLTYLFDAVGGLGISRSRPFTFCIDEYENFEHYQKIVLNTLVKGVGASPYTFKIGVRNATGIARDTLVAGQPLQDPADFRTVDIVRHLKDKSFAEFARTVVDRRLGRTGLSHLEVSQLLPSVSLEEEAALLGGPSLRSDILAEISPGLSEKDRTYAENLSLVDLAVVRYWSVAHAERASTVLQFARTRPKQWRTRVGNHAYAMLFTLRERAVGPRKYYCGWRTICQLADGNIRYLLRVAQEALGLHANEGGTLLGQVSYRNQTEAARRAGETTLRELQGWSREGGALTRLTLSLGRVFGGLAREVSSTTPEVNQFRVTYSEYGVSAEEIESLLNEAVGQGVIIAFDGDKNARLSGATREYDYQLHPIFSAYFTYSHRRKRRLTITAEDLKAMTTRQQATTIRRILESRGVGNPGVPDQLRIFEDGLDAGP